MVLQDSIEMAPGSALSNSARALGPIHHHTSRSHGAAETGGLVGGVVGQTQTPLDLYQVHRSEVLVQQPVQNGVYAGVGD